MSPWLSVLIPAHNAGPWIGQTLNAILAQLDGRAEVLVLDDGSTDDTAAMAQRMRQQRMQAPNPPRMELLSHSHAQGVSAARNRLLQSAGGQWLWFVDADDVIRPGALQRIEHTVQAQADLDVVLLDHAILRPQTRLKHRLRGEVHRRSAAGPGGRIDGPDELLQRTLARAQWHPWGRVVRRAAWPAGLVFPQGRVFEDLAVIPQLMAACRRGWHLAEPLIDYRSHPGSILGSMDAAKLDQWHRALLDLAAAQAHALAGHQASTQSAWLDHLAAQAVRLVRVAARRSVPAEKIQAWQHELVQQSPALPALTRAWWRRPRRWSLAWAAAHQGWPEARPPGAPDGHA